VPVLSWLLCAERSRKPSETRLRRSPSRPLPGPGTGPRPVTASHLSCEQQPTDQSTVPHRIHDSFRLEPVRPSPQSQSFSQSYRSILPTSLTYMLLVDERLFTLETCCGYGYDPARKSHSPSEFQGPTRAHQTPQEPRCSTDSISLSPDDPIPGSLSLMKKRQLFLGHVSAFPSSFALPHLPARERGVSDAGFGNINPIPFR
jgi:hypothetical protein